MDIRNSWIINCVDFAIVSICNKAPFGENEQLIRTEKKEELAMKCTMYEETRIALQGALNRHHDDASSSIRDWRGGIRPAGTSSHISKFWWSDCERVGRK